MELLLFLVLLDFFPVFLFQSLKQNASKDEQQLGRNRPLISDQAADGSSTLSRFRRHGVSMQVPTMPPCCVRKGERLSRRLLNFLHGGYQRAEASSISQCDDRFTNESSNESKRRWRGAMKQKKTSSRALDIRRGLVWWHWMIYGNDVPWSHVNYRCFLHAPRLQ